jgi:hypothetical protein
VKQNGCYGACRESQKKGPIYLSWVINSAGTQTFPDYRCGNEDAASGAGESLLLGDLADVFDGSEGEIQDRYHSVRVVNQPNK